MPRWPEEREHEHPSRTCFMKHGCKCDGCREMSIQYHRARRARVRERAIARGYYTKREHTHPSLGCYKNHLCRCAGCKEINSAYTESYRASQEKQRDNEVPNVLPPEEIQRIRKMIGLSS